MGRKAASSKKATTRQTNRKPADMEKEDETPTPRPPYALVLYEDNTAGVVESDSIPDDAILGSVVEVPEPVDMPERSAEKSQAKLLQYGHSVDFLNDTCVSPNDAENDSNNQTAIMATQKLSLKADNDSKCSESSNLRTAVSKLAPLFQSKRVESESVSLQPTTLNAVTNPDSDTVSGQNPEIQLATAGGLAQATAGPSAGEGSGGLSTFRAAGPSAQGTAGPSSSQSLFPEVTEEFIAISIQAKELQKRIPLQQFPPLPCFTPGPDKLPLGESDIYLPKRDVMNIKWVVARPHDAKPKQKIPKDHPNAVFPREMVCDLLNLCVPDHILFLLSGLTIPEVIFNAVKDYINFRLKQQDKLPNKFFHDAIYEHIRAKIRGVEKQMNPYHNKENKKPTGSADKTSKEPKKKKNTDESTVKTPTKQQEGKRPGESTENTPKKPKTA